jgi:hypothetical protein
MPSNSLLRWRGERAGALDEIEAAHAQVGGTERGRRYATQQINRAYAVLLSSEFQGFGRDLYSECVDYVVASLPGTLQSLARAQFLWGQPFSRGNPQAGVIGSDFGRLGLPFWADVYAVHAHNRRRRELLDELMQWRNAIAHNDFDPAEFGPDPVLHIQQVRRWRSALNALCDGFDRVLRSHLSAILGAAPGPLNRR